MTGAGEPVADVDKLTAAPAHTVKLVGATLTLGAAFTVITSCDALVDEGAAQPAFEVNWQSIVSPFTKPESV